MAVPLKVVQVIFWHWNTFKLEIMVLWSKLNSHMKKQEKKGWGSKLMIDISITKRVGKG